MWDAEARTEPTETMGLDDLCTLTRARVAFGGGQKHSRRKELHLAGHKDSGWVYTYLYWGCKMEIPGEEALTCGFVSKYCA